MAAHLYTILCRNISHHLHLVFPWSRRVTFPHIGSTILLVTYYYVYHSPHSLPQQRWFNFITPSSIRVHSTLHDRCHHLPLRMCTYYWHVVRLSFPQMQG